MRGRGPGEKEDNTVSADAVISYDELKKLISSGNFQIFDVRSPKEVNAGKIPSSVNIPVTDLEDALKMDPEAFKQKYLVEKPQPDNNLVFHCQMGKRGQQATEIALGLGYRHARNYLGAYKEWSEKEGK
ncbi:thiosulfate:glutathione sulfurtransferase isoform X1 [Bufo bufo]|uniref:thiosulfate:glutathione sulfurtransferase isoform X1 n=1 Tax=Bufo bufo TaxID=8384 RepID=UPI001ABDA496|nr:thiosulfate:glutathione sulfurtransferase isoform X1 [Bufo bufo]